MASTLLVAGYLLAITVANLAVAHLGPGVVPLCSFLLVGFDLVVKDVLQERWAGARRVVGLGGLIGTGSALSYLLASEAGPVALASCLAFGLASTADALTLAALSTRSRDVRVNGSNLVGAVVDSLVFPLVAFGGLDPQLVAAQVAAKMVGGFAWWTVLRRVR